MAGAYQKKSRWNRRIAVLAAILAALAAAASFWLALGKTCRLQLKTDLSGLSPTVSGVFARAQLPFQTQVQALQMDSDVSVSELYAENSVLGQRLAALTALGETIQRALDGLSADSHGSVRWDELDPTMFTQLSAQIGTLRVVLALLGLLLVGLLVGGVLLALLGRPVGSCGFTAAAALLTGSLPLGTLYLARNAAERLAQPLQILERFGIGCEALLTLTRVGYAQILLAIGALLLAACGWLLCARGIPKRRRSAGGKSGRKSKPSGSGASGG